MFPKHPFQNAKCKICVQQILLLPDADLSRPPPLDRTQRISINDATFTWPLDKVSAVPNNKKESKKDKKTESEPLAPSDVIALSSITLSAPGKHLIGVCGPVGSGKSALVNAISGHVSYIHCDIAYLYIVMFLACSN
jgi:ABC-type multidrug transport system fused ATPase/permease subunit